MPTAGPDLIPGYNPSGPGGLSGAIIATRVATFFTQPVFVCAPPGDTSRLFVVERNGAIKIIDLTSGQVLPTPFLDVSSQILTDGERGLLGLAFDPDFATNGFFYVNLINGSGNTEIRRYHVSSNPNVADPSATPIITINQPPGSNNHKGGWLGFGPDGDLYASLGDGGGSGDQFHNGQNINSLLGKILRIDVHGDDFPSDPGRNYHIPADNPFVGQPGADEIFALGLRNPWRPSFDRATGDFYIADVGQDTWEEIDIGQKGANYGWNHFEGPALFPGGDAISTGPVVAPIYSYNHNGMSASITGGYVYRGDGDALQGQYFFADFVQGKVFTLAFNGSAWVATDRTSQIVTDVGALTLPSSFGEDGSGNLYIVDLGGNIFRLTPTVFSAPPPAGTTADMILRRGADGMYEIYNIGNNTILAAFQLGQIGTEWQFVSHRPFYGSDAGDMLLRSSTTGGFELYDISNNQITGAAFLGTVGMEWQVMGFGNFSSRGESDMILRNSNTGGLQVYDISNNQITGTAFMGTVGLNWQFSGVGNFSSRGTSDMLLRNSNTGGLEVYDINSNQITGAAFIGTIGVEWQFSGVGNFSGVPGESDLLLRNINTGGLEVYNINNNQLTGAAFLGTVGLDWQFAGIAPLHAAGASDLVLRNVNTGAFQVYVITNNQIAGAASLGAVGLDWQLGGFAADPPAGSVGNSGSTSQLVQAMAGFGGGSGAGEGLNTAPLGADTSQQPLLTTPQHA